MKAQKEIYVALREIFISQPNKHIYRKPELHTLKINLDFIKAMANQLNLSFLENEVLESNTCFANNSEVRPEFRTTFNKMDLISYVSNVNNFTEKDNFNLKNEAVPFPRSAIDFWNLEISI